MNLPLDLLPGDVLLYNDGSDLARATAAKCNSDVAHAEIVAINIGGHVTCVSAHMDSGVGFNPFHADGLKYVLRPTGGFDAIGALQVFRAQYNGRPYGYGDIEANLDLPNNGQGMDCSHTVAQFSEDAGCPLFRPAFPKPTISPRDLLTSVALTAVWSAPPGGPQDAGVQTTGPAELTPAQADGVV